MADVHAVLPMNELPGNATNSEALAWVTRMRRLLDRWETLPEVASRSLTPELKRHAHGELDEVERGIRRNMALPHNA
jgi:hypothetical protein